MNMEKAGFRLSLGGLLLVLGFITVHADSLDIPGEPLQTCPDGWSKIHRGCYKFVTTGNSWQGALDYCKSERGDLTSIQSVREKDDLQSYLNSEYPSTSKWWVGFSRDGNKGSDWKWQDKLLVSSQVTPWVNARLAERGGDFCGMLQMSHNALKVSINFCSTTQPFICEYHTITPRPSTSITTVNVPRGGGATITLPTTTMSSGTVQDGDGNSQVNDGAKSVFGHRTTGDLLTSLHSIAKKIEANTEPMVMASTQDENPFITFSTRAALLTPGTSPPSTDNEEGSSSRVRPPGDFETESTPDTPDEPPEALTLPPRTFLTTTPTPAIIDNVGDDLEEEEEVEDKDSVGKGQRMRPTYLPSPSPRRPTRPSQPIQPSPTRPAWTRPNTPQPTMVDWDKAFEEFEGCFLPGNGGSLRETVMAARRFYGERTSCPAIQIGSISWPATMAGETAKATCHKGDGSAEFECGEEPVCWMGQPDVTDCASKKLQNLLKQAESSDPDDKEMTIAPPTIEESVEMSSQLVEATETEETTMEDVIVTSQVITAITKNRDRGPIRDKEQVKKIVDNVVKAGSNLVSANKSAMWEEMSQNDKIQSASKLLVAMESATISMAEDIDEPTVIVQKDENIELELRVVDVEEMEKEEKTELVYGSDQSENTFSIPVENLKGLSKGRLAKAVFMTHYSMADILGGPRKKGKPSKAQASESDPKTMGTDSTADSGEEQQLEEDDIEEEEGPKLASYILSASLGVDGPITNLPKPISFTMKHLEEVDPKYIPLCSFWNVSEENQLGFWSQDGCRVVTTNKFHTTCECDHMTNFAILLDVHGMEMSHIHKSLLRLVTIIGCVISCISLLASWITFQCFASLQGERNSIHKNLALTLLVAELLFVFGIDQAEHQLVCSIIAGFLHFFFLAAFTWMFIEGIHIIFMLVQVFDSSRSRLPYYYFTGYGAPLVVVGASCLFYYRGYGTDQYCWLTTERYFIWAFAGPVALILLVNALFMAYAMSTVCRHSDYVFNAKEKATGSGIRAWIQGALALEVLLGLTWTIGYFLINDESVALAYIFAILNSLQGLFIFIFHCLLNKKAQKEYRRVMNAVVSRTSSSGTHSTYTKRTSHTNPHDTSHTHNQRESGHAPDQHELNDSLTGSHQKLNATNSHSMA